MPHLNRTRQFFHIVPLLEDTVVVTETVAPGRVIKGGEGVHVAGSKTTKTSVTEGSVDLRLDYVLHVEAELFDTLYKRRSFRERKRWLVISLCEAPKTVSHPHCTYSSPA